MKVAIGADHGGFELKKRLIGRLQGLGHEVTDVGTSSNEAVDYPVFARAVAEAVAGGRAERGIMIDGAGIGSSMVANKVPGVRAALGYDLSSARNGREHNDANVLTLGAGLIGANLAEQVVDVFLTTPCTEARHLRRVAMFEPTATAKANLDDADVERIVARLAALLRPGAGAAVPAAAPAPPVVDLARYIDHTILKPAATRDEVLKVCAEAREHGFRAVCVNPCWVKTVSEQLDGAPVLTCSVVGFPLGASASSIKAAEARQAIRDGAKEIDMVINVGALKGGDDALVLRDIRAVTEACADGGAICKVIIETVLLTDDEKIRACELARTARAHFVKTSTGFAGGGATARDVAMMAAAVRGAGMEVKASGGIRSYADARQMIEAGATRIGASASVAIVREARSLPVGA
jgi:deoxyribose-phosphate aldolase